jgi:hypothetical protein
MVPEDGVAYGIGAVRGSYPFRACYDARHSTSFSSTSGTRSTALTARAFAAARI